MYLYKIYVFENMYFYIFCSYKLYNMSHSEFLKLYEPLKTLSLDASKLEKIGTKTEMAKTMASALDALKTANELIAKQADLVMATNQELTKQCEIARNSNVKMNEKSFSAALKKPTFAPKIILRPADNATQQNPEVINNALKDALKNIQVNSARVSNNGTVVVDVPSLETHAIALDN